MKSLFEQLGGTYTLQGDYYLPDLALPTEEETQPMAYGDSGINAIYKTISE